MTIGDRPITTINVFEGTKTVAASATETSIAFDLRQIAQEGYFSIEYTIGGSGTCTIGYTVCSTKGGTYFVPTGGSSIATSLTAGTGGKSFSPAVFPFMKIYVTETGTSNSVTAKIFLNIQ